MRRLGLGIALGLALLVPATAGAAQSIGITLDPASIKLLRFTTSDHREGLLVRAEGVDGKRYEVQVGFPSDWETTKARLPMRFDDLPAGTTVRPCFAVDEIDSPEAADLFPSSCAIAVPAGFAIAVAQAIPKRVPDFGGPIAGAAYDIYISARPSDNSATAKVFPNPTSTVDVVAAAIYTYTVPGLTGEFRYPSVPVLQAYPRWSKFYSGTLKYSVTKHFPVLFGSLSFAGVGVYGPGNRYGAPTNSFGRNVYIDTLDSDYGKGWHRIMGVLTQPTNGTFCYEFSKKGGSGGKTGISSKNTYRLTAIGPGLTPIVRVEFHGPTFPFGNDAYNPLTDTWGTNLSPEQTAALQLQATLMGPNWARPVKGTDCAQQLRQLPPGFIPPTS
ncbi:MAG: hypothetical protein WCN97_09720 [Thermoleophilia bacterium]